MDIIIVTPHEGQESNVIFDATIDGCVNSENKYILADGEPVKCVWAYDPQTVTAGTDAGRYQYTYTNAVFEKQTT